MTQRYPTVAFALVMLLVGGCAPNSNLQTDLNSQISLQMGDYSNRLSEDDVRHGEKQIGLMLKDRPSMAPLVDKGDEIWIWTVRQFAGAAALGRIYWNGATIDDKLPEYIADHKWPYHGKPGWIRINRTYGNGQPVPGERQWSAAVFELNNIRNGPKFARLYEEALRYDLSEEQWVKANTRIEFEAHLRRDQFFKDMWQPHCRKKGLVAQPKYWFLGGPTTFEQSFARYKDHNSYPWSFWGKYYEEKIRPYAAKVRQWQSN